jgi:DNA-binding beta-propeller fold protein YncE
MRLHRLLLAGVLAIGMTVFSASAQAKVLHGPITSVLGLGEEGHTGGSTNGELAGPSGVAVDESTEDVYVVDRGNSRVEKFDASGAYLSQFNGGATPAGSFSEATAVAVDQGTGDVYVADTGHNVVDKFTSAGAYVCELSGVGRGCQASPAEPPLFSAPVGVAVDPTNGNPTSGDVYVSDKENKTVDVFTSAGGDVTQFQPGARPWSLAVDSASHVFVAMAGEERINEYTPGGGSFIRNFLGGIRTVGVDLQSGDIFAGAELEGVYGLEEFDSSGHQLGSFGSGLFSAPGLASPGIAVNSTTHVVYAADTPGNVVDLFGPVTIPDPTACSATAIGTTSATLRGEVNPNATKAEALFQYGTEPSYGQETPLALVGGGAEVETNVPVEASIGELTPGTIYHCRIKATNSTGLFNEGADGTFETLPLAPVLDEPLAFAIEVTATGAVLGGFVNPGNGATTYHFAYGTQAHVYTTALPDVGIGSGLEPIAVEQATPPLALHPGTIYHFALIAKNAAGTTVGTDRTFTTLSAPTLPETLPVVSTGPAISITPNTATLTATVYPENTQTSYRFELGTTTAYGTTIFGGEAGRELGRVDITQLIGSLQPGTTYHYRLLATSAAGTTAGPDRAFTTTTFPPGIVAPATPGLVPIPVFPVVHNPVIKPPKKHHKKHKPKRRKKAHTRRAKARTRGR